MQGILDILMSCNACLLEVCIYLQEKIHFIKNQRKYDNLFDTVKCNQPVGILKPLYSLEFLSSKCFCRMIRILVLADFAKPVDPCNAIREITDFLFSAFATFLSGDKSEIGHIFSSSFNQSVSNHLQAIKMCTKQPLEVKSADFSSCFHRNH
ncbi:UNVERIFIED_CONTAM: hypothetical protein NCL1_47271 [Trichonephila clavipes]